jgi:DNA-binding CsgD family transcriptional regulator
MPFQYMSETLSFSRSLTSQVKLIMKDLFANTNIDNFLYIRGNQEGSVSALFSQDIILRSWLEKGYPLNMAFNSEYNSLQSYAFWWSDQFPHEFVSIKRDQKNGFSIVRRYPKYFEMFGFSDPDPLRASFYMSCLADFNNFADHFVKVGKDIINQAIQHPLALPDHLKIKNHEELCLGRRQYQYATKGLNGATSLSSYECYSLQLLSQGKSYKEIARILSVSDKTIEKYLMNIKKKTGYNPREIVLLAESENSVKLTQV